MNTKEKEKKKIETAKFSDVSDRHLLAGSFFDTLSEPARIDSVPHRLTLTSYSSLRDATTFQRSPSLSLSSPPFERQLNGIKVSDEKDLGCRASLKRTSSPLVVIEGKGGDGGREEDVRRFKVETGGGRSRPSSLNSNNARYE